MRSLGRHTCKTGRERDRNHLFTLSGGLAFDEVGWQASIRRKVFLLPSPKTPKLYSARSHTQLFDFNFKILISTRGF